MPRTSQRIKNKQAEKEKKPEKKSVKERQQQKPEKKEKKQEKEQKEQKEEKQEDNQEAEPEQKTKKIVKAKKYKQKSYDQRVRIEKSKHERIFLISATRNQENWYFTVQGTKGTQYYVHVSTVVSCTCMDYRFKKIPCKHIYFIVTQVGQNEELLDYFKSDRKISKNAYKILDEQLQSRLKSRLEKPSKQAKDIDLKDDTDCVICFSEMDKETEGLEDCSTCKKYFHSQCILAWKAHNPSCPLCRGSLVGGAGGDANDPLGKVVGIKL